MKPFWTIAIFALIFAASACASRDGDMSDRDGAAIARILQ